MVTRTAERSPAMRRAGASSLLVADVAEVLEELDRMPLEELLEHLWPEPQSAASPRGVRKRLGIARSCSVVVQ